MKKKILIPIIVAAVIVIGGGGFAYSYHSSNTVRIDVTTLTGVGHYLNFDKITPNSKYNSFRENVYEKLYSVTRKALPLGVQYSGIEGEGDAQLLTDKQLQDLTGTDNEKDMRVTVTIVKQGTKVEPNEIILTNESINNTDVYTLLEFWHSK